MQCYVQHGTCVLYIYFMYNTRTVNESFCLNLQEAKNCKRAKTKQRFNSVPFGSWVIAWDIKLCVITTICLIRAAVFGSVEPIMSNLCRDSMAPASAGSRWQKKRKGTNEQPRRVVFQTNSRLGCFVTEHSDSLLGSALVSASSVGASYNSTTEQWRGVGRNLASLHLHSELNSS